MGSEINKEHEQIPPQMLAKMEQEHKAEIKSAFSNLNSTSAEERRLAAVRLRQLSDRGADITYLVSEKEVRALLQQIEKEKELEVRVAEVSALNEVYYHTSSQPEKLSILELLKKMNTSQSHQEIQFEAQYQKNIIENGNEAKDMIIFDQLGLNKKDHVKADTMFAHTTYDFTRIDIDSLGPTPQKEEKSRRNLD